MGEYICQNCGKTVDNIARVVCPYCSGRILIKRAGGQVKELPAE
jgi:DNA-directed RNA polymerase subunit RPC12/RpoP